MQTNAAKGQLFSSATAPSAAAEQVQETYQPAKELANEGAEYDALAFDLAAAGFEPLGWSRPKSDLRFVLRQTTIPEYCRAIRLTMTDGGMDGPRFLRQLLMLSVIKIGDMVRPSDDYIEAWLEDLHTSGVLLVDRAYNHLCYAGEQVNREFDGSKVYDPGRRCFTFKVPRSALPKKTADSFTDDELTFSMRELSYTEMSAASDACDDPDDGAAIKTLRVMWAISSIGGQALGQTAEDLMKRRRWLARLGHPAFLMIAGTWTRMHEVDKGLVDRFLGAACAPA